VTRAKAERWAWIAGAAGVIACAIAWYFAPARLPFAWLAAFACGIGWPLGSLALILTHALTGGRWGKAIWPQLLLGVASLPLVLLALVPVLLSLPVLYPWTHSDIAAHLENTFYLNRPFFFGRMFVYIVAWLILAGLLFLALRRPNPESMLEKVAPFGLIVLGLTATFSMIDFAMSLDPAFRSSVYGLLTGCQFVLFALSIATLLAALAKPASEDVEDLGKLLLGLVVLWAYLDFVQLLIIWQSNLPYEAKWYAPRLTGEWGAIAVVSALCHFALPFFVLIWPQAQRSPRIVAGVSALLVATGILRAWWLVLPGGSRTIGILDALAMLAVFGLAAAVALRALMWLPAQAEHHV